MKQVTYEIRGLVTEAMIPAITASCESLSGIKNVRLSVRDENTAFLTVTSDAETFTAPELELSAILRAKGLELCLPALAGESEETSPSAETDETPAASIPDATRFVSSPPPKAGKQISLTAALSTVIVSVVLAVLLTFSLTTGYMKRGASSGGSVGQGTVQESPFAEVAVIDRLFRDASVLDLDEEALLVSVLKSYVEATGDEYAQYLTPEEYAEQSKSNNGEMCGIGVNVVSDVINVDGVEYQVITISDVYPDSPAVEAGVLPGDHIMYVGTGEDRALVHDIGYDEALSRMKGAEGTECSFTVLRKPAGADEATPYEEVEITAVRKKLTTRSVTYRVYAEDKTVGIIRMTGFNNTTRDQFVEAVETLKKQGCTSFVLDLRGNPGGLLTSVEDVLVFFLQEGDTIITTEDSRGNKTETKVGVNTDGKVTCGTGELTREDVGKYRDLKISLLVNGNSASAAELFTSNIRDYELGSIVGTKTYGKGCGQTTFSLSKYGYDGALKLTTFYYYPPCGEGYDGIGIIPHVKVELSEEAKAYNINILPDELDNQLAAAVESMK